MVSSKLTQYAHAASQAAKKAGAMLASHLGQPKRVEIKRSEIDLVTELDRASEQMIRRHLLHNCPNANFLGEERGQQHNGPSDYRWIVDPLDGTMNFVHGVPLFGVSIGLEYRSQMIIGVVYDPMRQELFSAIKGRGAWLNEKRIHVSRTPSLAQSLLSSGFSAKFRTHPQPYLEWFRILESHSHAVRRVGTTVLCLAYVAAGRMEAFYEQDLWPWDIAAGMLLVQEAGGRVTNFTGKPVSLDKGELVASNGRIHQALLQILKKSTRPTDASH